MSFQDIDLLAKFDSGEHHGHQGVEDKVRFFVIANNDPSQIWTAFNCFDKNHDGLVTKAEFR